VRIVEVRPELGLSRVRVRIGSDLGTDLGEAVELEHPCEDSACDIRAALESGHPHAAAMLLEGATETPVLEAVRAAHGFNGGPCREDGPDGWPVDWEAWTAWHREHGRPCPACEAWNYPVDGWWSGSCSNCLADIPDPEACEACAGTGYADGLTLATGSSGEDCEACEGLGVAP